MSAGEYHEAEAQSLIRTFNRVDFLGAVSGIVFVVLANAAFIRNRGVWLIVPFLAFTSAALWLSARRADRGEIFSALVLVALGNWVAAIAVAVMFPFLWPVMVLTVVMPLVLATPFLESSQLVPATATTAFVAGAMAIAGLLNDDGGVIPDLADELELFNRSWRRAGWRPRSPPLPVAARHGSTSTSWRWAAMPHWLSQLSTSPPSRRLPMRRNMRPKVRSPFDSIALPTTNESCCA